MVRLNGWQRLWVLVSLLLLLPVTLLVVLLWPARDAEVVRDLASLECAALQKLPPGFVPERYPSRDEPCRALQAFLIMSQAEVRSVAQYDSWLSRRKARTLAVGGLLWASAAALVYLAGRSVAWVRRGFQRVA